MNVLLTCAGRRTSLLNTFQQAAHPRGGRVLAGDMDPLAPTLHMADEGIVLPPVDSDEYTGVLLNKIKTHQLRLLVPTIDPELPVLDDARSAFEKLGCDVLVSRTSLLEISADKWSTVRYFSERGVRTPHSWLLDDLNLASLPETVFVKPRHGSASKKAQAMPRHHLVPLKDSLDDAIIQEVIEAPEITVDALFDLRSQLLHYVPRLRMRTLSGESIQGKTIPDSSFRSWLLRVLNLIAELGARGPITVQAFLTDNEPTLSEINPRFAGGFPLTYAAGGHYPDWILMLCAESTPPAELGDYQRDLHMTRYFKEHFTNTPHG